MIATGAGERAAKDARGRGTRGQGRATGRAPVRRRPEPAPEPIRVAFADDAYVIREFLAATLGAAPEVELVAVCTNGKELQSAIRSWHPDVVITDIRMPPTGTDEGIRIAAELRESYPRVGVIVLSQYADPAYALSLLEHGTGRPRVPAQGADPRPRRADRGDQAPSPRAAR